VKKGIPFRHDHEIVGKAVAEAIATKTSLDQLDLAKIDPARRISADRSRMDCVVIPRDRVNRHLRVLKEPPSYWTA